MSSANRDPNPRPSVWSSLFVIPQVSNPLALSQTMMSTGNENDLVQAVDKLLNNLGPKFSKVSAELFTKSTGRYHRSDFDID